MPRRGRPAQGHAPAEGLAQNDMAHLFVADAEHRTQALGATRMGGRVLVDPLMDTGVSCHRLECRRSRCHDERVCSL